MTKKHCLWKTRKKKEEIQIHGEPGKREQQRDKFYIIFFSITPIHTYF